MRGTRVPAKQGVPLMILGSIVTTDFFFISKFKPPTPLRQLVKWQGKRI